MILLTLSISYFSQKGRFRVLLCPRRFFRATHPGDSGWHSSGHAVERARSATIGIVAGWEGGDPRLALAENVVMDIVLHGDEYDDHDGTNHDDDDAADASNNRPRGGGALLSLTASWLVPAFATKRWCWCNLSLSMLLPLPDTVSDVRVRGIRAGGHDGVHAAGARTPPPQ